MPNCQDWNFEATPVDFIAECMVSLSKKRENFGKVYHIIENEKLPSLKVFNLLKEKKYVENLEDFEVWCKKVEEVCEKLKKKGNKNYQFETVLSIKESLKDL